MKSKNFKKKLTLNKKTIADLKIDQMKGIHGGFEKGHLEAPAIPAPPVTDDCYDPTITGYPCMAC